MVKVKSGILLLIVGYFFFGFGAQAQLDTEADFKRLVYKNEFTGGIMFHTRGYGLNLRRSFYKDGFQKTGFELDIVNIRHPKEIKTPGSFLLNSPRSFVYGKLNGLYAIRTGYGVDRILIDKTDQGTIAINWLFYGGVSWGLLKPIYVLIGENRVPERYDPDVHNYLSVYSQASFFTGFSETKLVPGLYVKSGFSFDYNFFDDKVATIEVGTIVDYFFREVVIMDKTDNYQLWWQVYLTFNIGTKWN